MLRTTLLLLALGTCTAQTVAADDLAGLMKSIGTGVSDGNFLGGAADAEFGYSVANAGDINGDGYDDLLVGSPSTDVNATDAGAAHLFFGSATGFDSTPDWRVLAVQAGGRYGSSVAGVGDVNGDGYGDFVIGAQFVDNGQTDEGLVYLYLGGTSISIASSAVLQTNQGSSYLGGSVAGAGDVNGDGYADIIAGAAGHDGGATNSGAAFIWFGSASFDATVDVTLTSSQVSARMGTSVAGVGDVNGDGYADILVGAKDYDFGQTDEGAAFLYLGGAGAFNTADDAHLQNDQAMSALGSSVSGAGDVNGDGFSDVIVGAPLYDDGHTDEGAVSLYLGSASGLSAVAATVIQGDVDLIEFGTRVSGLGDIDGDGYGDVAVSAPKFANGQASEGRVGIYLGGPSGLETAAHAAIEGNRANGRMGTGLALIDHNGDGRSDLFAGSPGATVSLTADGVVSGYRGEGRLMDASHDLVLEPNNANANSGSALASGDVNGDGYTDLLVGQPVWSGVGRVVQHIGTGSGLSAAANASFGTGISGSNFGNSLAVGDVNGDGFADVIVGSSTRANGQSGEGLVHLYYGGAGAFDTTIDLTLEMNQALAEFGYSVAFAGDVNGDGFGDVLVGARLYDSGDTDEGAVFLFLGGTSMNADPDARYEVNQAAAYLGYSVAGIGDINGDGFADLAAGGIGLDATEVNGGIVSVWFGGSTIDTVADRTIFGTQNAGRLGSAVSAAGDVNGDGFDDFVVGAFLENGTQQDQGSAYVFLGGSNPGTTAVATLRTTSTFGGGGLGSAAAPAGDVNGDGYADFWVGTPFWANGTTVNTGLFQLYLGGSGAFDVVADRNLTQAQANAQLGQAIAAGDFDGDGDMDVAAGARMYDNSETDEGGVFVYTNQGVARPASPQSYRAAPFGPLEAWNYSADGDGYVVGMEGQSPAGRERAKLMVESCPTGKAFGATECSIAVSPSWTDLGATAAGVSLAAETSGLAYDSLQRWRARVVYAPYSVTQPGIVAPAGRAGPWRRLQGRAGNGDVRIGATLFKDGFE